jgi:hypothetical protein
MAHLKKYLVPLTPRVLELLAEGINPAELIKPTLMEVDEPSSSAKDFIMQMPSQPAHWPAHLPARVWQAAMAMQDMGIEIKNIRQPVRERAVICDEILIDPTSGLTGCLTVWREDSGHTNHAASASIESLGNAWIRVCDANSLDLGVLLRKLNYGVKVIAPIVRAHGVKEGERQAKAMMARFSQIIGEALLCESPQFKTLKKNRKTLSDEERREVMAGNAFWHHGPGGEESPAVWKSVVNGETWYCSNTHRAFQADKTIKAAIRAFHDVVEPSS